MWVCACVKNVLIVSQVWPCQQWIQVYPTDGWNSPYCMGSSLFGWEKKGLGGYDMRQQICRNRYLLEVPQRFSLSGQVILQHVCSGDIVVVTLLNDIPSGYLTQLIHRWTIFHSYVKQMVVFIEFFWVGISLGICSTLFSDVTQKWQELHESGDQKEEQLQVMGVSQVMGQPQLQMDVP